MLDQPTRTDHWTPKKVRAALVEAYVIVNDTVTKPGHRRLKAAWPETMIEWSDLVGREEDRTGVERPRVGKMRAPVSRSSIEIARAEMVLCGHTDEAGTHRPGWLNGALRAYPRARKALMAWVMVRYHFVVLETFLKRRGWKARTFERDVETASRLLAQWLNAEGIPAWEVRRPRRARKR